MKTRIGLALAVIMAMPLAQVRAGRPERMRSLVGTVPYLDTALTSCPASRQPHSIGPPNRWKKSQARTPDSVPAIYLSGPGSPYPDRSGRREGR